MGSLMEARRRILLSSPHSVTIQNADIASFSTDMRSPLRSLRVGIDPVQDLHGFDSPWPGGGGKNKFDISKMENTTDITVSNGIITVTGNAKNSGKKLSDIATLSIGETYILTATVSGSNVNYVYLYGSNESWYFGVQRTITQADLDSYVFFYGGVDNTSTFSNFMIRLSSISDATYAPYSNLCPISGWDSVTAWRTGKNLDPYDNLNSTTKLWGSNSTNQSAVFRSLAVGTYTMSCKFKLLTNPDAESTVQYGVLVRYSNGQGGYVTIIPYQLISAPAIVGAVYEWSKSFTLTESLAGESTLAVYFYCASGGTSTTTANAYDIQLELGSTPTPYAPYTGTTYPITIPTPPGTVYGGYISVGADGSAELVVDRAMFTFDSNTPIAQVADNRDGNLRVKYTSGIPAYKTRASGICSAFPVITTETAYNYAPANCVFSSNGVFVMPPADVEHAELAYTQWLSSVGAIDVVMELATPLTYPLSDIEVSTLAGQNVMWADCGEIELLKYWTHK